MKKAIAGIVAVAGLASMAAAATTVTYQVRTVGGVWGSSVDAAPGTQVEFRALLSYSGSANVIGMAGFNSQPMVGGTVAGDAFAPFLSSGVATISSVANSDSGTYGRRLFTGNAGISTSNALRAHTNTISGVRYMRIAQNNTTNFPGLGAANNANNTNGAGGVSVAQTNSGSNPNFVFGATDVEVQRFAFIPLAGNSADRTLSVSTDINAMLGASLALKYVLWYTGPGSTESFQDTAITIVPASIHVPTPGAIALLGLGGLVAGRRRR